MYLHYYSVNSQQAAVYLTCKTSVRFGERQKFKLASHKMRLTSMARSDVQCAKRVGYAWMASAPAHSQKLNRPWQPRIIILIVFQHNAAAQANNVTDACCWLISMARYSVKTSCMQSVQIRPSIATVVHG